MTTTLAPLLAAVSDLIQDHGDYEAAQRALDEHDREVAAEAVSQVALHPIVRALLIGQPVLRGTINDIQWEFREGKRAVTLRGSSRADD